MSKHRNPKGRGYYYLTSTGKHAWRIRQDGTEKYLQADTPSELQKQIDQVIDLKISNSKLKVDVWFQKWLSVYIQPLKSISTYNQYRLIYNTHIKEEIGKRKLINIKSYDIQYVIAEMNKKGLSTWTMKHARKIMNGAFSKALKDKIISLNPVQDIEIPNKQAKPRKTLTNDELIIFFKELEKSRWIWSAKFMLVTGMRRGELLALRWSDIDYKNKRITIDESNSSTGLSDTKNRKIHSIPLSKKAEDYLKAQKEMLEKEFNPIMHNETLKKENLVFPNKTGKMLKPGSYYTMMARAAEKVGIKASPHCLRHTFVYMNRNTLSLKELQNILGHDESTTTLDIYGDMINESTDEVAKQIDEVFKEIDNQLAKVIDIKNLRKIK